MPNKFKKMQLEINSIVIREGKKWSITKPYKKILILPIAKVLTSLVKSKKVKGTIRYITINYSKN